jgi:hypothetical protein
MSNFNSSNVHFLDGEPSDPEYQSTPRRGIEVFDCKGLGWVVACYRSPYSEEEKQQRINILGKEGNSATRKILREVYHAIELEKQMERDRRQGAVMNPLAGRLERERHARAVRQQGTRYRGSLFS